MTVSIRMSKMSFQKFSDTQSLKRRKGKKGNFFTGKYEPVRRDRIRSFKKPPFATSNTTTDLFKDYQLITR